MYPVASMPPFKSTPPDGFVPMAEAVKRIGRSDRTLRRWIEDGRLEGEPIARPQGIVWYVKLPPEYTADAAEDAAPDGDAASDQENAASGNDQAVAALDAALRRAEDRADALDERNERQAAMLVERAEQVGRLQAERDEARRERDAQAARAEAAEAALAKGRRWWWFWA